MAAIIVIAAIINKIQDNNHFSLLIINGAFIHSKIMVKEALNFNVFKLISLYMKFQVLLSLPGEAHLNVVELLLSEALLYYKDRLSRHEIISLPASFSLNSLNELKFPGKVAIDKAGTYLSDTVKTGYFIATQDNISNLTFTFCSACCVLWQAAYVKKTYNNPVYKQVWHLYGQIIFNGKMLCYQQQDKSYRSV